VAFSLDQLKKQQKSVKSRALKPPKLLHIIPLKTVEISDRKSPIFHLTHKITKSEIIFRVTKRNFINFNDKFAVEQEKLDNKLH
jgi:hypothetical protein